MGRFGPRRLDDVSDEPEGDQQTAAGASECAEDVGCFAVLQKAWADPKEPAAAADQALQSAQQDQGEFDYEHLVSLPQYWLTLK